jgi:hypothetical protein
MRITVINRVSVIVFLMIVPNLVWSQPDYSRIMPDTSRVNELLRESFDLIDPRIIRIETEVDQLFNKLNERGITDPQVRHKMLVEVSSVSKSIRLSKEVIKISEYIDYLKGKAYALKNIGFAYYHYDKFLQTNRDEAFKYWREAVQVLTLANDNNGAENLLKSIWADIELINEIHDYNVKSMTEQVMAAQQVESELALEKQKQYSNMVLLLSGLVLIGSISFSFIQSIKNKRTSKMTSC